MTCDTSYLYSDVFQSIGTLIRTILLDPSSLLSTDLHFPIDPLPNVGFRLYEDWDDYDAELDTTLFKGILVWHARKYYSALTNDITDDVYRADAGFYVVPTFGNVIIRPNVEYKQLLTVVFDSNSDFDFDPFNAKIIKVIDTFVNNVNIVLERYGEQVFPINGDRQVYTRVVAISKGGSVSNTVFERRVVTIELRYCHCY